MKLNLAMGETTEIVLTKGHENIFISYPSKWLEDKDFINDLNAKGYEIRLLEDNQPT